MDRQWTGWANAVVALPALVALAVLVGMVTTAQSKQANYWLFLGLFGIQAVFAIAILFTPRKSLGQFVFHFLLVCVSQLTLLAIAFPIFAVARSYSGPSRIGYIKHVALAVCMYTSHHDEVLPPLATWEEAIGPYYKQGGTRSSRRNGRVTMNGFAVGFSKVDRPNGILLYESTQLGPNPVGMGLDAFWYEGRGLVAFGDGHVKGVRQNEWSQLPWIKASPKQP